MEAFLKLPIRFYSIIFIVVAVSFIFGCAGKKSAIRKTTKPAEETASAQKTERSTEPSADSPSNDILPGIDQLLNPTNPLQDPLKPPGAFTAPKTPGAAATEQRPTPEQIMASVQQTYQKMHSLKTIGTSVTINKIDGKKIAGAKPMKVTVIFSRPNKISISNDDNRFMTDGKTVYNYVSSEKSYVKDKMNEEVIETLITNRPGVNVLGLLYGVDYDQAIESGKLLPDSKIAAHDVYVLALNLKEGIAAPKGTRITQTLWIGKKDMGLYKTVTTLIARPEPGKDKNKKQPKLIEQTITTTVSSFQPNVTQSANAFAFKPPAGVKQYEPPKPLDLRSKQAPDFAFVWTDGTIKKLSDFKGKTVLLDFVSLPMCDPQLPVLKKVNDKLKSRAQLIVVDVDRDEAASREHLKNKGYGSLPVVFLDEDSAKVIDNGYGLVSLPTMFIINSEGIVQAQAVGVPSEKQIEDNLNAMEAHDN